MDQSDDLLIPLSTAYKSSEAEWNKPFVEIRQEADGLSAVLSEPSTPEDALDILRSEPDLIRLRGVLNYLVHDAQTLSGFNITHPSPIAAKLVNVLVSSILPNYWTILKEGVNTSDEAIPRNNRERKLFLSCLRSITGLNALIARLKALVQPVTESNKKLSNYNHISILEDYVDVLENLLRGEKFIAHLWRALPAESISKKKVLWKEVSSVVGGGKVLNCIAEATGLINDASSQIRDVPWIAVGKLYSLWLAKNLLYWFGDIQLAPNSSWNPFLEIFTKSLRLGYPDIVISEVLTLLFGTDSDREQLKELLNTLSSQEMNMVIDASLKTLSKRYLSSNPVTHSQDWWKTDAETVACAAAYMKTIISEEDVRQTHLISWLTGLSGAGVGEDVGIRRIALAVLSDAKNKMELILEKSLHQFADQLYIRHAPSLQQEVHTQVLLISAGYVHRSAPLKLASILRSSVYLNAVSNRLGASSTRARFLGMVVGEALSSLVEKPENKMKFNVEEIDTFEAQWYRSLTTVVDTIGSIDIAREEKSSPIAQKIAKVNHVKTGHALDVLPSTSKIVAIEEVGSDESEETDLVPYDKPDSDAEDSEEDPTLVQRNRPTAPVYIRDLIVFLRDTENYDRQKLALATASSLIRRKTNFGTEVSDHVVELATLLVGLQDKFDMEDFQELRLQSMIAVLISQPLKMGKWFSTTFFEGDYSVAQRASILTVLSMSARELAGFQKEDSALIKVKTAPESSFPSKLLSPKLHKIYAAEQQLHSQVDQLSEKLSRAVIQPLAASIADKATGPDILKVRTFSSRLAVESRRKTSTTNALSKIVANSFFFPLTGLFFAHFKVYGSNNVMFEPYLLSSFLKTLGLILHASGPLTLELPSMTSEFWDLLLSLRVHGQENRNVGQALLFAFMTLLEVNEDQRRLAENHGKELIETQAWVELIFDKLGAGTEEEDKVRGLAAGVLFKIREAVEKYQNLLIGNLSSF